MENQKRVIALGFFDGIHIGHAALMRRTVARAEEMGAIPTVMSFDVHPDTLVRGTEVPLINSAHGREELIRRLFGIESVVFIHFDRAVMQMPWQTFIQTLVDEMDAAAFVVGHDFCFGWRGEGTAEKLSAYCVERGLGCDVIPAVTLDGRVVSSTYIRELLENGEVERANAFLGHPHTLSDTVHYGYRPRSTCSFRPGCACRALGCTQRRCISTTAASITPSRTSACGRRSAAASA